MSNHERDEDDDREAAADREKARCRRNRRPSVQFIDKNLIRRRSSGNDKPTHAQLRLSSLNATGGTDPSDLDYLQQYSENDFSLQTKTILEQHLHASFSRSSNWQ